MGRILKLRSNRNGFAPILIVVILAVLVGVGGVAYWRISSYNKNDDSNQSNSTAEVSQNSSTTNSATLSDECVAQTGDPNICHLGAISDLSKYASEVHMTLEGSESVILYDGKGNYSIDLGNGLKGMSFGGKYYVYMDAWYDTGDDPSQVPETSVPSLGFATTAGITYENLGKEPCGSATCFNYRLSGGILGDGVVTTLFGDQDYLPRRIDSTGGLIGKLTMTVEYKDVTLAAPEGAQPISSLVGGFSE